MLYAFRDASFIGEDTLIIVEASLNTDFRLGGGCRIRNSEEKNL